MILSIESSCDDSSIAITEINTAKLLFHKKISQESEHSKYGGVVPELAARLHAEALPAILEQTKPYFSDIKAIAVTNEPGLGVTLLEGIIMAKALSVSLDVPLIAVNHLIGHIYSLFIETQQADFPLTVLLVSGGHTQIMEVHAIDRIEVVAKTLDDSFGESFDKCAKMLNLGYPGGPEVEKLAYSGDGTHYPFTVPLSQSPKIAFSFSGLKNAVRLATLEAKKEDYPHIAASFQKTAIAHIVQKLKKYFKTNPPRKLAIVGGASANIKLREAVESLIAPYNAPLLLAPLAYCSDNAAMIGRAAVELYNAKCFSSIETLQMSPKSHL